MNRKNIVIAAALTGTLTLTLAAKVGETRNHYKVIDSSRHARYDATVISTYQPSKSAETYLLRNNETGTRLTIQVERDAVKHETAVSYSLDSKRAAKVKLQLPFS